MNPITKWLNKNRIILFVLVGITSTLMAQQGGKSDIIKPTGFQKRVTTIVSGKTRYYYFLNSEQASVITHQGPGKIRVVTRGRFRPDSPDKIGYEIVYKIDGGAQKVFAVKDALRSATDTYQDGKLGIPAGSREFEIELGRGDHTIEFMLKNNLTQVAARFIFTPTKEKKQDWIAYSPLRPSEPVDLISKESTVSYYRFSIGKPLKIEITGPSEMRVLTRIENHYQMKGRIHYRIQIKENNSVLNTYQLSSDHSEVAVYAENSELIPGKACEFVILVPAGKHIYEIAPLDEDKNTILGRLLIPKKDVKLVE
jgi:hypothetical protein